jgi:MATE family multidrug resistance protein
MLLFMTLKQFADGLEHTRTAMIFSLAGMPVNILLNWLLIYGNWGFPRLELEGAGWATLITRTCMFLALGFVVLRHKTFEKYIAVSRNQWKLKAQTWRELCISAYQAVCRSAWKPVHSPFPVSLSAHWVLWPRPRTRSL